MQAMIAFAFALAIVPALSSCGHDEDDEVKPNSTRAAYRIDTVRNGNLILVITINPEWEDTLYYTFDGTPIPKPQEK